MLKPYIHKLKLINVYELKDKANLFRVILIEYKEILLLIILI